jgi:transcriptional regulator with XRE-family HTH domain
MKFGEKVRHLRQSKGLTLRQLAPTLAIGFHYLSKIENEKLGFGEFPSEDLIRRLAEVLQGDESELLLLARKVPGPIKKRILERPEVFRVLAECDDATLDRVLHVVQRNLS